MDIQQRIIQETPHWLAINKPAGLIVEKNPFEQPTIEDLVWDYLQQTVKKPFLGIVHRLDRVTSGVLLLAKKKSSLKILNQQFAERKIKKTYWALCEKWPHPLKGQLDHWHIKDQQGKRALIFDQPKKKAVAVSLQYELQPFKDGRSYLEIHPLSGKFHQIRAQLAFIDCPILGDDKYGAEAIRPRSIALHASSLQFYDPQTNKKIIVEADMESCENMSVW